MGDIRDFYKQERTCCLSIQLFTAGMMIILYFNTFLAIFCACMSFFGPKILALVQPVMVSYIFGGLYLAVAGLNIFGIICVERNFVTRFRTFKNLTLYVIGAIVLLGLVFIMRSASQHTTSVAQCMEVYHFPVDETYNKKNSKDRAGSSSSVIAAMTVCDLFSWAQIVVMGTVWLGLTSMQLYFGAKHRVYYELKQKDYLEDTAQGC
ncbi:hypothetical protein MJO28_006255 [Puccinia striiformis f. sp. tritici]|uniref:Uncharacterized protein n=3 Tax=Puccinia striiformis TaxID=27350 RepID=A0A0L0VLR1_9BASI|nr:hypothetical protein Pst134EA_011456 [Puccinia striiformis f. sp. tritici]KNE99934.1 hypothetical protein PSTG_06788 [Puccinia striiformis f. sp. tritici PST-78]POV99314.1 hypothetical protein PSTT_13874 [Puccinia striiformis]KAH9456229.1 hypothetical protein Pst134EB_012433 [Puccinia striiformis f. sp. tritici]KAH9467834.1 hypothetical protein Pst134EA_011456 [Puccinia striiformis f. sp. tritici]KAI7953708.1 hypothetical protein MJO28_006255 [Puccinia striiformis f. sp. tritici]